MEIKYKINIAKDFSAYPAGRFRSEGDASGEAFLLDHLLGKLIVSIIENCLLEIDLNDMNGYPSSFISGSFGKITFELGKVMGQKKASELVKKHIVLKCEDSSSRAKAIEDEINNPISKR
jgi:hypothetical protein